MSIARNPEVPRKAQIAAELDGMVADVLGDVVGELELLLSLGQRAIATVGVQRVTDLGLAIPLDVEIRDSGREVGVEIESGDASILGRAGPDIAGQHINPVPHVAETEIVDHRRIDGPRITDRQALIAGF